MVSCKQCDFFKDGKCDDPVEWVNGDGEEVCRYQEGAEAPEGRAPSGQPDFAGCMAQRIENTIEQIKDMRRDCKYLGSKGGGYSEFASAMRWLDKAKKAIS